MPGSPTDLLVELLGTLATYNVTVSQLKLLVGSMKADDTGWVSSHSDVLSWRAGVRLVLVTKDCAGVGVFSGGGGENFLKFHQ